MLGRVKWDGIRFRYATQNSMQFISRCLFLKFSMQYFQTAETTRYQNRGSVGVGRAGTAAELKAPQDRGSESHCLPAQLAYSREQSMSTQFGESKEEEALTGEGLSSWK